MNSLLRAFVALMLCVLLPVQAGATLVRSTAMSAAHALKPAAMPQAAPAPAVHTGQHAHHHAAFVHPAHQAKQDTVAVKSSHKERHAKAECQSCAKCCLLAASAPPPALGPAPAPAVARAAFVSSADPAPSFLTDGPERPPRSLAA